MHVFEIRKRIPAAIKRTKMQMIEAQAQTPFDAILRRSLGECFEIGFDADKANLWRRTKFYLPRSVVREVREC